MTANPHQGLSAEPGVQYSLTVRHPCPLGTGSRKTWTKGRPRDLTHYDPATPSIAMSGTVLQRQRAGGLFSRAALNRSAGKTMSPTLFLKKPKTLRRRRLS